jgi:hypothetical protein
LPKNATLILSKGWDLSSKFCSRIFAVYFRMSSVSAISNAECWEDR